MLVIHHYLSTFLVGHHVSTAYIKPWRINLSEINELNVRRCYRAHNADVLTNCPKDRLLVLDGNTFGKWEIFCEYMVVLFKWQKEKNVGFGGSLLEVIFRSKKVFLSHLFVKRVISKSF